MYCIAGLGNPEARYENTRHNIGFRVVDEFAGVLGVSFSAGKGECLVAKGSFRNQPVLLVKPTTYMNRSGIAVQGILRYYKIPYEHLLVILDDLDLPLGTIRFRPIGSDAGNKGMRSIIMQAGRDSIPRMRIGIRNRDRIANPSSYVLSGFNRSEKPLLPKLLDISVKAAECWLTDGIKKAMNKFNGKYNLGE